MNRTKMRFSPSDFRKLAEAPSEQALKIIQKKLKVTQSLAHQILDVRPRRHEDFLKVRGIYENRQLLITLVQASASESAYPQEQSLIENRSVILSEGIGLEFRLIEYGNKQRVPQVALKDAFGDFCCTDINDNGSIDFSTLHFLGIRIPFLWMLNINQKGQYHTRLHKISRDALQSIIRRKLPELNQGEAKIARALAGLTIALQNFTASSYDRSLYANGYDPLAEGLVSPPSTNVVSPPVTEIVPDPEEQEKDCTQANGCGPEFSKDLAEAIPEFTFHECCNQHDRDYCEGCSECERVQADNKFFECMLKSAKGLDGAIMAAIYYLMVRAIGMVAFSHCFDRKGIAGIASAVVSVAAGIGMGLMALNALLSGIAALGIGVLVTAASMFVLTKILCLPCELIDDKLKEVLEEVQEFEEKIRKRIAREKKKCKKKRGWLNRLKCRIKKVLSLIIVWIMIMITLIILTVVITTIRILICGGLTR